MWLKPQVVPARVRTRQWNCMFQCKANMMASDRDTWVCKCLQLIYLSALHLTLFDIYIAITIINSFNQMSLSWRYDYLPGAWIFVDAMICKRASPVMGFGFGSVPGQTGWQYSKHESQRQNCWEAVEIGTWWSLTITLWQSSLRELQILWLGWSQIAESTDTWLWQSAPCTSGLSHRLCCNERGVRICVAGWFNCTKGDPSLVALPLSEFANVCSWFIRVHST